MSFRFGTLSALGVFALVGLIACGKSETKNSEVAAVPIANPAASCPPGSTLTTVNGYQMCQGPQGTSTPIYQMNITNPNQSYSSDNYCYRSLTITNMTQAQKFLKEAMGVCDQNQSTGGTASCDAWARGYFKVNLMATSTNMAIGFYAYPQQTGYYYSLPSFSDFFWGLMGFPVYNMNAYATRNPLSLGMKMFTVNNNLGFEGRTNGDMYTLANRSLIQIQVAHGHPGDLNFDYSIAYEGIEFMRGMLVNGSNYSYYCGYGN